MLSKSPEIVEHSLTSRNLAIAMLHLGFGAFDRELQGRLNLPFFPRNVTRKKINGAKAGGGKRKHDGRMSDDYGHLLV